MILTIEELSTAVDKGYEEIARLQLDIAKRSRMTGDINIYNKKHMLSLRLYAAIDAMVSMMFNTSIKENEVINVLYNQIKTTTKDLRQWT